MIPYLPIESFKRAFAEDGSFKFSVNKKDRVVVGEYSILEHNAGISIQFSESPYEPSVMMTIYYDNDPIDIYTTDVNLLEEQIKLNSKQLLSNFKEIHFKKFKIVENVKTF